MERLNKTARALLLCLTLLLVLIFSVHKVENRDFGWLLKTGEYIYETHKVPRADFYSFTVTGNKYIDSHWLFQLLLFVSYRLLGIVGPTLLVTGALLVTFLLVYFIGYDREKYVAASVFTVAAVVIAGERFLARPHIVTLLFLAAYFFILERHKRRDTRAIFLLPVLQLFWVNMHGLFVMGLILPAVYLFFALIEWKVRLPWKRDVGDGLRGKRYVWLVVVLVVMILESFLNPYTTDVALYPFTLFKEIHGETNLVAASVTELMPPLAGFDLSRAENYFKWMIYISALCFLLNLRRLNLTHLCLFGAFAYLAVTARRNMDIFAVIAAPIAVTNVGSFMNDVSENFRQVNLSRVFAVVQLVIAPLIMVGIIYMICQIVTDNYYISDRDLTRFGFGVAEHAYPIKAANFIEAENLDGNMFNDPRDGGYLIWRFYPERKVYYDGRWEVYGNKFLENYGLMYANPVLFEERAAAMNVGYALLHYTIGYMPKNLIEHLMVSPRWKPVYFDDVSLLFVRNTPENAKVIEKFGIDFATFENEKEKFDASLPSDIEESHFSGALGLLPRLTDKIPRQVFPFAEITRASFCSAFGYYDNARLLYRQALDIYPDSEVAHAGLGVVYWKQRLYSLALAEFEAVDRLSPRSVANLTNLANLNLALGRLDDAEKYFRRLKRLDRRNATVRLQLGRIYARKGMRKMAADELRRALKLDPDLREASELLRQMEEK